MKSVNTYIALALLFAIPFLNLSYGEIQPWDEALYAIRAKIILSGGSFFDQTHQALGGLYSSTEPPLFVWLMSLSMWIFGEVNFSVRFVSAFSSGCAFVLLFFICSKIIQQKRAILASLLLSITLCWNSYSRLGMLDIFLNTLFLADFLILIYFNEKRLYSEKRKFAVLFGFFFLLGLLTKMNVSFIPILFLIVLYFQKKSFSEIKYLVYAVLFAIALASPWYLYMISIYKDVYWNSLLLPHIYSVVENNDVILGPFYYLNQFAAANSLLLFSFILCLIFLFKKYRSKIINESNSFAVITCLLWFICSFLIFSLARTRMHHYTNYMIPSAIILATIFIEKIEDFEFSSKQIFFILAVFTICIFRQFFPAISTMIKSGVYFRNILIIPLLISGLFFIFSIIHPKKIGIYASKILVFSIYSVIGFMLLKIVTTNLHENEGNFDGAIEVNRMLKLSKVKSFIYLYHEHTSADSLAPQLAWYSDGWTCGWQPDKSFHPVSMPETGIDYKKLKSIDSLEYDYVVYLLPKEKAVAEMVKRDLYQTRNPIIVNKSYAVFGMKVYHRKHAIEL